MATREEAVPAAGFPTTRLVEGLVFVASIAAALGLWEVISRAGLIDERDLPSMSTVMSALWDLVKTRAFWDAFAHTVRGWALGLGVATLLAVPIGLFLGSNDFAARAFRVPVE